MISFVRPTLTCYDSMATRDPLADAEVIVIPMTIALENSSVISDTGSRTMSLAVVA